jgi:hypothetical protein
MLEQLEKYFAGTPTTWLRGGIPYIYIHCTDEDLYSATNREGRTYSEDQFDEYGNPKPNRKSTSSSQKDRCPTDSNKTMQPSG